MEEINYMSKRVAFAILERAKRGAEVDVNITQRKLLCRPGGGDVLWLYPDGSHRAITEQDVIELNRQINRGADLDAALR